MMQTGTMLACMNHKALTSQLGSHITETYVTTSHATSVARNTAPSYWYK